MSFVLLNFKVTSNFIYHRYNNYEQLPIKWSESIKKLHNLKEDSWFN